MRGGSREHVKTQVFAVNVTAHHAVFRPGYWQYLFSATLEQAVAAPRTPGLPVLMMDGTVTATSDNYVLIAADMTSTFVVARRIGFVIESIPHLFATGNNRPSGQRGLFGFARNSAAVVDETAGALLNVT